MEKEENVEGLWEDLNLGGLLNDLARENESALAQAKRLQARRDPFRKHNKMLKNPAYSVLMDRYGAAPPQPKLLAKSTLSRLSHPVKGKQFEDEESSLQRVRVVRDTKMHPRKHGKGGHKSSRRPNDTDNRRGDSQYDHSPIRKEAWAESRSPTKYADDNMGGNTFLTGVNDDEEEEENYDNEDFDSPPPSPGALLRQVQGNNGLEYSPLDQGVVDSPGRQRNQTYTPPDIYSPRTKNALRESFQKETTKTFSPKKMSHDSRNYELNDSLNKMNVETRQPKAKSTKRKPTIKASRRTRGSSLEKRSNPPRRKKKTKAMDEQSSSASNSNRVQLLTNKMKASKKTRVVEGRNAKRLDGLTRSTSVKGIRQGNSTKGGPKRSGLAASRSAPTIKNRNRPVESKLPAIPAASSPHKPTSLPELRAKNLFGRKGVTPSLQQKYANILNETREAHKNDAQSFQKPEQRSRKSLQSLSQKKKALPSSSKVDRKSTTKRKETRKLNTDDSTSKNQTEQDQEKVEADLKQKSRLEARELASKKKEEMEFRQKIRKVAEENAARVKSNSKKYETVDEKLVSMFRTHCARLSSKLSEADKISEDFKNLKEFDGYSIKDRRTKVDSSVVGGAKKDIDAGSQNPESDAAFLSKQLIV